MGRLHGKLGEKDASGAIPPEQEAIRRLRDPSNPAADGPADGMRSAGSRWDIHWY